MSLSGQPIRALVEGESHNAGRRCSLLVTPGGSALLPPDDCLGGKEAAIRLLMLITGDRMPSYGDEQLSIPNAR